MALRWRHRARFMNRAAVSGSRFGSRAVSRTSFGGADTGGVVRVGVGTVISGAARARKEMTSKLRRRPGRCGCVPGRHAGCVAMQVTVSFFFFSQIESVIVWRCRQRDNPVPTTAALRSPAGRAGDRPAIARYNNSALPGTEALPARRVPGTARAGQVNIDLVNLTCLHVYRTVKRRPFLLFYPIEFK